jgi:chromosome segregation ATPase
MEFQDYAATETSALVGRLLGGQAGATLQQLQVIKEAIEAARQALEAAPQPEQEIDELVARLTAAASEEVRRAGDESRRISQEARRAIDEAEMALQLQVDENARLAAAVAKADAETALLKSELETAQDRADSAERDFLATVDAHGELEAALKISESEIRQLTQAKSHLEADLAQVRATLDRTVADADQLRHDLDHHQARRGELEQQLATAHHVAVERDALIHELERIHQERAALHQQLSEAGETAAAQRDALARDIEAASNRTHVLETELESAHGRIGTLEAELAATNGRAVEIEALLAAANGRSSDVEAQLAAVSGRSSDVEAQLAAAAGRAHDLEKRLESAHGRTTALEHDLAAAIAAVERHDAIVAELEMSRVQAQTLEAERTERDEAIRQLQLRLDDALQAEARLREQAETKLREAAARASDASGDSEQSEALRWEVERMVSLFDASVRAVNEMASARTSAELNSELVKRLSLQFSRVALFRVKGQALEGDLQVGFEDTDISRLVLPMTADSLLTRAAHSGAVESITGSDISRRLGTLFNGSPRSAVALPIVMQGTSVAVVYADDADMPDYASGPTVHESSVAFAKLLVGEAALLMMCHTHELKVLAELRQYATTLLQEAKEMYLADAEANKPAAQLRARLKDNLECASQLYTYRAAMEGTAAAALLDEQIAAEMAGTSQFARDLGEVVRTLAQTDLGITAEAS